MTIDRPLQISTVGNLTSYQWLSCRYWMILMSVFESVWVFFATLGYCPLLGQLFAFYLQRLFQRLLQAAELSLHPAPASTFPGRRAQQLRAIGVLHRGAQNEEQLLGATDQKHLKPRGMEKLPKTPQMWRSDGLNWYNITSWGLL